MVMQKTCNIPGCVPLETAIAIVFPRPFSSSKAAAANKEIKPLIPDLPESAGGTYKTNILKPLSEVVQDDILDALPPELGGRRDPVKRAFQVRDEMFGRMQQTVQDKEGLEILAEFLIASLKEYVGNGCVAPELGMPFENFGTAAEEANDGNKISATNNTVQVNETSPSPLRLEGNGVGNAPIEATSAPKPVVDLTNGKGNFVFTRVIDNDELVVNTVGATANDSKVSTQINTSTATNSTTSDISKQHRNSIIPSASKGLDSKMAWRKQQEMSNIGKNSSSSIIQQIYEREHAPGIRRAGCPCCDPDDPSNALDEMMLL